jgi:hypothetical protein
MQWWKMPPDVADWTDDALANAHATAQKHLRLLQIVTPVVVIVLLLAYGAAMRAAVVGIDADQLAAAFERRMNELSPRLERSIDRVASDAGPVVGKALEDESARVLNQIGGKLDKEVERMRTDLPSRMQSTLDKQLKVLREAQIVRIKAEVPELGNDDAKAAQLVDAMSAASHEWAIRQLTSTFNKHLIELDRLKLTLQRLASRDPNALAAQQQAAEAGGAAGGGYKAAATEKVSPDQILALWLEIFEEAMNGPEGETLLNDAPAGEKETK